MCRNASRSAARCAAGQGRDRVEQADGHGGVEREYCLIWLNAASTIPRKRDCGRDDPQPVLLVVGEKARAGRACASRHSAEPSRSTHVIAVKGSFTPGESARAAISTS